jgi:hypothetical protein
MKELLICLTLLASLQTFASVDIKSFHNKNFNPLSAKVCGTHVEVSGNTLIISNIIPPRVYDEIGDGCGGYNICEGQTYSVDCEIDGKCYDFDEEGEKKFVLRLLEDGNYYHFQGHKALRSSSSRYKWCN